MDSAGQDLEVHLRLLRGEDRDARKSPAGERALLISSLGRHLNAQVGRS